MREIESVYDFVTAETSLEEVIRFKLLTPPYTTQVTNKVKVLIDPINNGLRQIAIYTRGLFGNGFYQDMHYVQLVNVSEKELISKLERKAKVFMMERKLSK